MKESEKVELKKSTSEIKEAIISIVSILNKHQKGELYFGVKNNGVIVGQTVTENTMREISQTISNNIEPKIFPKIREVTLEGKTCIVVDFSGKDIPYFAYGRAYIRVSDEDKRISTKELETMFLDKNKEKLRWDKEICDKAKFKDISPTKLKRFLQKAGLQFDTLEISLDKLGLLENGKITNAAVILFGEKPEAFFPNARLRCAVFGTTDTAYPIDMQDFTGDIFTLIEKAEDYILKNIHIGMRLEGLYRVDVPEINKEAFREAIINAFCHRNYYEYDSVNVAVFKDRLEIRSPGGLYGGLTISQIRTKNISKRRNELIAEIFHRVHFVEKWGRGIKLILSKEPSARLEVIADIFITIFKRKTSGAEPEKVTEKVTENQQKILTLIEKNKDITVVELAESIQISRKSVLENIAKLKQKHLLSRIGPDKGGHWEIII